MNSRKNLVCWTFVVTAIGGIALGLQYEAGNRPQAASSTFAWPQGKRAALSLSFDDARPSQVDNGVPLFDRHGVKVTFYLTPSRINERLEQWKKAAAAGHEMANHSMVHPCSGNFAWSRSRALEDYTIDKMRTELTEANDEINRLLGVRPKTFAYPCGQTFTGRGRNLQSYVPLVAELFVAGRGWLGESPNDPTYCDLSQLMGMSSDNLTFEQLKPLVDQAIQNGLWLVLAGHDIGSSDERQTTQVSTLDELCRYVTDPARGVWVDTVANVAGYLAGKRNEPGDKAAGEQLPAYKDPSKPIDVRVEDLLSRMSLEEKIGQMNMPCVYEEGLGKDVPAKLQACRKFAEGTWEPGLGPGGGFFTLANTILHRGPREQAEYFNELQRIAIEKTRLGIPLLQTEEGTHGLMCSGHTIFPEGLALGSTWNPDLIRDVYSTVAREARAVGIHQLFTLVIEPNRDPRLGRNQEGYSEDPYLISRFAETIARAMQGTDISGNDRAVAGFCHYPGQSQPVSGLERGAMEISERTLREVFLPSWAAGIKKAGALGVMATYPAIDGVPAHASGFILTRILREELNFKGLVLSEGGGIGTLVYEGLAADQKAAGQLALKAGLDVGISYEKGFMQPLGESVREGTVSMALIDRAVRRILRLKFQLGLFERPFVDVDRATRVAHTANDRALALQAGREGIVLLKNDGNLLPIRKNIKSIAVIGPNADHPKNQLGDYTSKTVLQDIVTILEGIRAKVPGAEVRYVRGCEVVGEEVNEIEKARQAARGADVAIVVVGENEWQAAGKKGTNGEGYDVASLDLTGIQEELIKAVHSTGTPTVVVLVNGRPLSIRWTAENVPAIVESWIPGEQGGHAVADVLFGDYNPSGRLPITVPRHVGQLPAYYNHRPSKSYWIKHGWGKPYANLDPEPLFEFGFGLSYTSFQYGNLLIKDPRIGPLGEVHLSVDVTNTGARAGDEVVQLYVHDQVATVSRPVEELKGFSRIHLEAGQTKTVDFVLGPEELSMLDQQLRSVVEPGVFEIMIGRSCKDIKARGIFEVVAR